MGSRSKDVVMSYLEALNDQDFNTARSYLNDNMTFLSPVSTQNGADAYFKDMERLRLENKIKMVLYDVKKVFLADDDVCVFFDFHIGSATLFASGWFHVTNGKINSIRVVFDPRPIFESAKK